MLREMAAHTLLISSGVHVCVVAVRFERAKRRLNRTMEKIDHAKEQLKVRTNSTPD